MCVVNEFYFSTEIQIYITIMMLVSRQNGNYKVIRAAAQVPSKEASEGFETQLIGNHRIKQKILTT